MKKLLLIFCLFLGVYVFAFGQTQGGFSYSIVGTGANRTITITGYNGLDTIVTIPHSIDGIPVTVIGARSFRGSNITSVTIPASITAIRDNAFSGTNLISVTFLGNMNISNISNTYDMASNTSSYPFPGSGLNVLYPFRGPGTYTRSGNSWSGPGPNQPLADFTFPTGFYVNIWRKIESTFTLFLTENTLKASNQSGFWNLVGVFNDTYYFRYSENGSAGSLTIKLEDENLIISNGLESWNGTWIR